MSALTTSEATTAVTSGPLAALTSCLTPARSWFCHKPVLLAIAAGFCASFAWSGRSVWLLPLSLGLPLLLGLCETRKASACVAGSYFAVALWPCIGGAQAFFEQRSLLTAILLWAAWVAALTSVFALLWWRADRWRALAISAAVVVHAMLPIGLASPLTSAGVLFPSTNFAGVFFTLVLCFALSARAWKLVGTAIVVVLIGQARYSPSLPVKNWRAVNTSFGGKAYQPVDPAAAFRALMWVSNRAKSSPSQVLLFPENVLPEYSDAVTGGWMDLGTIAGQGTTILIGSDRTTVSFGRRENVLLARGVFTAKYVQRIPIPVAMWGRDTEAHLFGPGGLVVGAHRAAVLLCYEQLLVEPVLQSSFGRPDILLAASNLYWARQTNVDAVERVCIEAWGRLFAVPYLRAVNR